MPSLQIALPLSFLSCKISNLPLTPSFFLTSLVHLTRQFKEIQARFDSSENELRNRFREVKDREREIGVREKQLEDKEVKSKLETEAQHKEMESSKSHLLFLTSLINKHVEELDVMKVLVREKKEKCDLIEKRVLESTKKLNSAEECVEEKSKEFESKEKELIEFEWKLKIYSEEIELKERHLNGILESNEEQKKECDLKEPGLKNGGRASNGELGRERYIVVYSGGLGLGREITEARKKKEMEEREREENHRRRERKGRRMKQGAN